MIYCSRLTKNNQKKITCLINPSTTENLNLTKKILDPRKAEYILQTPATQGQKQI
jgi:hypothetical protein